MDWSNAIKKEEGQYQIPDSWLFIHFYEALNILFRIENALRIFVYVVLKNQFREKWVDQNVLSDDSESLAIKAIARKRIAQAKSFGYLGFSMTCPVMFLSSGELIRIITSEAYWRYFVSYFLGDKEVMKHKLDEVGNVRNAFAHFRPIKQDDVELVKQNSKHLLVNIEKCLSEMIDCVNIVPTNTSEDWYKELQVLKTDNCSLSFTQSIHEEWIRITVRYKCPVIYVNRSSNYISYRALNIRSSAIFREFPNIANFIIYLFEITPRPAMPQSFEPDFIKHINFVFSKKMLSEYHKEIKIEIDKVLKKITEETDLIKQDNLARGKLVEAIHTYALVKKSDQGNNYWSVSVNNFICDVAENDPPEFWGNFDPLTDDLISSTNKYPWMPIDISHITIPF